MSVGLVSVELCIFLYISWGFAISLVLKQRLKIFLFLVDDSALLVNIWFISVRLRHNDSLNSNEEIPFSF